MGDDYENDDITDHDLEVEIELLSEVMTAVRGCQRHLNATDIDKALGLTSADNDHGEISGAVDAFDSAQLDVAGRGRATDQRERARWVQAG